MKETKEKDYGRKWKVTLMLTIILLVSIVMGVIELNITKFDVHSALSAGQWFVTGWLAFIMITFTRNM